MNQLGELREEYRPFLADTVKEAQWNGGTWKMRGKRSGIELEIEDTGLGYVVCTTYPVRNTFEVSWDSPCLGTLLCEFDVTSPILVTSYIGVFKTGSWLEVGSGCALVFVSHLSALDRIVAKLPGYKEVRSLAW